VVILSLKVKFEKVAKKVSNFAGLAGPLIGSILPLANSNVYFDIIDGNGLTMEIRNLKVKMYDGRVEPITLELSGKESAFLELIEGRSFASSWINGAIKIKGVKNNLLNALVIGMILGM